MKWYTTIFVTVLYTLGIIYIAALMIVYNHYILATLITVLLMASVRVRLGDQKEE